MADNKKYYYLKLKENFFDSDAMILLESMEDGYLYSNILLKLYLRSLKNEGKLMFSDRIPYNANMIAKITRHSVGVVEKAIQIYHELGLIEILDNGAIYMLEIQNFIGKSSTEADRVREYRKRIDGEKQAISTNVQQLNDKSTPEIEIEIEIEKDKELLSEFSDRVNEIVYYLNKKASTSYRSSSKKTRDLIKARLNENFTVDEFKKVIDNKVLDWAGGEMAKYLRPETLFGNKFESYLNTPISKQGEKKKVAEQATYKDQRKYNDDFYNALEEKI